MPLLSGREQTGRGKEGVYMKPLSKLDQSQTHFSGLLQLQSILKHVQSAEKLVVEMLWCDLQVH